MNFCKCLVKLCRTYYCFYQKSLYVISVNEKIRWLKFLFTSLLKAKKERYLLLNKGPSYPFGKFNWEFRTNFGETEHLWILKISELINRSKKIQKLLMLPSYKNFFLNVGLAKHVGMFRHDCSYNIRFIFTNTKPSIFQNSKVSTHSIKVFKF